MPMIEPSINGSYLLKLLSFLQTQGLETSTAFAQFPQLAHITEQDWVSAKDLNQFYQFACLTLDDPLLGVKYGQTSTTNSFKIVGFLALSATDFLTAFNSVLCYQSLYSRIGKMTVREEHQQILMCWDATWPRQLMHPAAVEASIAGWLHFGLKVSNDCVHINKVTFRHANTGQVSHYETLFNCPVLFNQEYDAIYFDRKNLAHPRNQADDMVHQALTEKARKVLATHGNMALVEKIENVLMEHGKGKILTIENTADLLNISMNEIRKSLKKSDISFRVLLDRCKFIEAMHYLLNKRFDLTDIAFELGFSEQSGFTRAFKRWTQKSPVAYRSEILNVKTDKALGKENA